jgi:type VI protein secretion system component Hcp
MLPLVEIDVVRVHNNGNEFIEQTFKLTKVLVAAYSRRYVGAKTNVEAFSLAFERDEVGRE